MTTHLFQDLFDVRTMASLMPQQGEIRPSRNQKGEIQLELNLEPEPTGGRKTSKRSQREPQGPRETRQAPPQGSRTARNVMGKNDTDAEQTGKATPLDGGHVELCQTTPNNTVKKWHSRNNPKTEVETMDLRTSPTLDVCSIQNAYFGTSAILDFLPVNTRTPRVSGTPKEKPVKVSYKGTGPAVLPASTAKALEKLAKNRYSYPRVFVILAQIAYLGEIKRQNIGIVCAGDEADLDNNDDGNGQIATERLLSRAMENSVDVRRALYRNLNQALELKLISRTEIKGQGKHKSTTYWELTADGTQFLTRGIKTRQAMGKISNESDETICSLISADELEEWKLESEERAQALIEHFGASEKYATTLTETASRTELVRAIEANAINKVQTCGLNNLWCGLVIG